MNSPNPIHPTHPPRALISGSSISGLTTAFWLSHHGFDVTVVERAPHLRPGGHALDVRGPALDVAERMGVLDALRDRSTRLTGVSVVDADGGELYRNEERTLTGGHHDSPDVEILRDDLCQVLYGAVGGGVAYLFGDSIASLSDDGSGVDATFEHAPTRRFEVVIGADGLYSGVRRIAFGPDEEFLHPLGDSWVATFGMPNFLELERWEVMYLAPDSVGALVMGLTKEAEARTYLGFSAPQGIEYDHQDIEAQKQVLAARAVGAGWVVPQLVDHMMRADDFHLHSLSQVRMSGWSRGRVVLVGDAGYAVSLGTGQATSVAMVGSYVLARELAGHADDLVAGLAAYEHALGDYVRRNQDTALRHSAGPDDLVGGEGEEPGLPDFGALTVPYPIGDHDTPPLRLG